MTHTHEKISSLVTEIQRLVQEEIDASDKKYEKYMLIDFSDKLGYMFEELTNTLGFTVGNR